MQNNEKRQEREEAAKLKELQERSRLREQQEEIKAARPGHDYHGRIVLIQGDIVVQRDARTNELVTHDAQSLTGGKLTLNQEVQIRYPHSSSIGLVSKMENQLEQKHQLQKEAERELER